jgi:hypothetical protein
LDRPHWPRVGSNRHRSRIHHRCSLEKSGRDVCVTFKQLQPLHGHRRPASLMVTLSSSRRMAGSSTTVKFKTGHRGGAIRESPQTRLDNARAQFGSQTKPLRPAAIAAGSVPALPFFSAGFVFYRVSQNSKTLENNKSSKYCKHPSEIVLRKN